MVPPLDLRLTFYGVEANFDHPSCIDPEQPTVWAAVIAGVFTLLGLWFGSFLQSGKLKEKVEKIEDELSQRNKAIQEKTAEVQRLETLLTPFRTIALEKYTGDEKDALRKFADYVIELQTRDAEQAERIGELQNEINQTKSMYGPPVLVPLAKQFKKTSLVYEAIVQFKPSNNSRVDGCMFKARVIRGDRLSFHSVAQRITMLSSEVVVLQMTRRVQKLTSIHLLETRHSRSWSLQTAWSNWREVISTGSGN